MVEFALVVPVLVFLMIGIIDLARIYTAMLSVESAAREAADFGSFGSQKWNDAVYAASPDGTLAKMQHRACVAASNLPGYQGPDGSCANPRFSYAVSGDRGASWSGNNPGLACDDATREPPCWVRVTMEYDFHLLVPLHFEAFGVEYGLPSTLTFQRTSTFAMTDLELGP